MDQRPNRNSAVRSCQEVAPKVLLLRLPEPAISVSLSLRFAGLVKDDYACNKILHFRDVLAAVRLASEDWSRVSRFSR